MLDNGAPYMVMEYLSGKDLALVLQAGALPVPLRIAQQQTIGPTLGADSIAQAKIAGMIAIIVVIDSPHGGAYFGGSVSAPIFKRIAESALRHLGIGPTLNPAPPVIVARRDEASGLWQTRGDHKHLPTLFNRGMAALFLGRPAEAREPLSRAVSGLPDDNSWHHLARLYLTLAEMRG